ncbi:MAG: hypothetical protein RL621_2142 [Bacteroidota bacterium]|jgi:hypothetical protein
MGGEVKEVIYDRISLIMELEKEIYKICKPLKNHIDKLWIENVFYVVWAYINNSQFNNEFPEDIEVIDEIKNAKSIHEKGMYDWELSFLVRECLRFSQDTKNMSRENVNKYSYFSSAINKIKDLEGNIYNLIKQEDFWKVEFRRIAHKQFVWQFKLTDSDVLRYFKIYNNPKVSNFVKEKVGITTRQWYVIGTASMGAILKNPKFNVDSDIKISDITIKECNIFFEFVSANIDTIKDKLSSIKYDENYLYGLNPLEYYPLVRVGNYYYCPIVNFLFWRITSGLYFDLIKGDNNGSFGRAFGSAFQDYLMELSQNILLDKDKTKTIPEHEYYVGKAKKDSVDIILKQKDAMFFVEAKAKRMQINSKTQLIKNESMDKDLNILADDIFQIYQTMKDYLDGMYTNIDAGEYKIYPLLVTLEDWYLIGEDLLELKERVKRKLIENSLSEDFLVKFPFSICSTRNYELLLQLIDNNDISKVMDEWHVPERNGHDFGNFIVTHKNLKYRPLVYFFPEEFESIYPKRDAPSQNP